MKPYIIACFTIISAITLQVKAQLIKFSATQTPTNSVLVNWTMAPGFTCQDLRLDHSTDSINYEPVYFHAGVCGDALEAISYSFEHTCFSCFGKNYYRLALGFNQYSDTLALSKLLRDDQGLNVYPNPAVDFINLSWLPAQSTLASISVYNLHGNLILTKDLPDNGFAILNTVGWTQGHYIISITTNSSSLRSRFFKSN